MGLRNLLKKIGEDSRPELRDMEGNVLKDAGWYLEYSKLPDLKIGLPVYFTGKLENNPPFLGESSPCAIVNRIYDAGSTPIVNVEECHQTESLVPMKSPREYLISLREEIKERSKLPVEQLSKASLSILKKVEEWMERELGQLGLNHQKKACSLA